MERVELEELKLVLRDKWLDYYEANQWIIDKVRDRGYYRQSGSQYIHNLGLRAEFILCTLVILEPRLKEFLSYFWLVCDDWDKILNVLDLNFNYANALEERKKQRSLQEQNECCHQ